MKKKKESEKSRERRINRHLWVLSLRVHGDLELHIYCDGQSKNESSLIVHPGQSRLGFPYLRKAKCSE